MKKTLRFSLLSMLLMLCGSIYAADDVTIVAENSLSGIADETPITVSGYTFTAFKNEGSTAPTYNANGKDVRLYAKNTLTIKVASGNMSKITFNLSPQGKKRLTDITASTGTIAKQSAGDETVVPLKLPSPLAKKPSMVLTARVKPVSSTSSLSYSARAVTHLALDQNPQAAPTRRLQPSPAARPI